MTDPCGIEFDQDLRWSCVPASAACWIKSFVLHKRHTRLGDRDILDLDVEVGTFIDNHASFACLRDIKDWYFVVGHSNESDRI